MQRVTFFGGKGGVGKTTCAAAAATLAATEGANVLVVSTDPAHSLGDALDAKLGATPVRIALGGGTRGGGKARGGALWAVQLDADRALHRWLRDREDAFKTIAERGTYLDDEDVERLFSLSLPGVDELVGLLELARLARSPRGGSAHAYEHVVVDTAPTGHTLRLLEMPETLRRFAQVLDDMHAKHRFLATSLGGTWRGDFADETIRGVERDADELRAMLSDATRTSFTWVTLPEPMAVAESEKGVRAIEALGVEVPRIVVNRLWEATDETCVYCTGRAVAERRELARIREVFAGKRVIAIPAAVGEPRGQQGLLGIARSARGGSGSESGRESESARESASASARERGSGSASASTLLGLPPGVRLVLVGGKGGVGKTSVACATAMAMAEGDPDKRILVLSTDPAHSLGDAMGVAVGDAGATVRRAPANVVFRELDAKLAFEAEKKRYREAIDALFDSIFRGNMDASFDRQVLEDLLDLAPPGLDELFAILSIVDALLPEPGKRSPRRARGQPASYDVVVVDTAPTGHTLRLLELPPAALEWVHAIMSVLLKYRHVVGLGDLASDLTTLARQLRALIALLADRERTAFVAVARAAALPRLETARLVAKLKTLRVPVASLVVNAVMTPTCPRCAAAAEREAPELARLEAVARRAKARMVRAPAVQPPPRGAAVLRAWCATWSARAMLGARHR